MLKKDANTLKTAVIQVQDGILYCACPLRLPVGWLTNHCTSANNSTNCHLEFSEHASSQSSKQYMDSEKSLQIFSEYFSLQIAIF